MSADGSVTVLVPSITAAVLSPNPANINAAVLATVTITEITKTLYPEYKHCGFSRSGGAL